MQDLLHEPWPWYIAGPLIGLLVPTLLLIGGKQFGISSNLKHICSAILPKKPDFLRYDWRAVGSWNLVFAAGIFTGGFIASRWLQGGTSIQVAEATQQALTRIGFDMRSIGLVPVELFSLGSLLSLRGFVAVVVGGFLVGFGARYADGCTSGHAISGLSDLQPTSLLAVVGFFAGGLFATHVILPLLMS